MPCVEPALPRLLVAQPAPRAAQENLRRTQALQIVPYVRLAPRCLTRGRKSARCADMADILCHIACPAPSAARCRAQPLRRPQAKVTASAFVPPAPMGLTMASPAQATPAGRALLALSTTFPNERHAFRVLSASSQTLSARLHATNALWIRGRI